ncbi:hypothetical protein ACLMJK_004467 [Lecanora helva]
MVTPTILTLPFELRQQIYDYVLNPPDLLPSSNDGSDRHTPNLSLLLTCRQVYHELRDLPLQLYHYGRYDEHGSNRSPLKKLRERFQIAALRRFTIYNFYPPNLKYFVALGAKNGYLFGNEPLNLDTLTLYTESWLPREKARMWRPSIDKEDPAYNLPYSARWLLALCSLKGWKMLNVNFRERHLEDDYVQRGRLIKPLFGEFQAAIREIDSAKEKDAPSFTIWHNMEDEVYDRYDEKISVIRTADIHSHGFREWRKADVGKLREGRECVHKLNPHDPAIDATYKHEKFHVQEMFGEPGYMRRLDVCSSCASRAE